MIACDALRATPQSLMVIRTLGGVVDRVGPDESAYPHRGARYNLSIDAGWTDPALDDTAIGWARSSWDALRPFATGGVYVNFAGLDEDSGCDAVFGPSAARLDEVQASYDPDGLFGAAARRP
jgi:berberine-like enzyme